MDSMTGYGRGAARRDGREITVELKAVNHRFLDLSFRMLPKHLAFLEDDAPFLAELTASVRRGHADVFINYAQSPGRTLSTVVVDTGAGRRSYPQGGGMQLRQAFWTSARTPRPPPR